MRPLMIGENENAEIARVVEYAAKHPFTHEMMLSRAVDGPQWGLGWQGGAPGDNKEFFCLIPVGFKCVYTLEQHPKGWYRHLSVSVETPGRVPSVPAVELLMKEFGIKTTLKQCVVYKEEFGKDKVAINVLELMDEGKD